MNASRWFRGKVRFGLSKLPLVPVRYHVRGEECDIPVWWSKVMPFLDPDRGLWNFDIYGWDLRELRFLARYLRPDMMFLDVGAYHGLYAVVAGKLVGPKGRVVAFEPTPHDRRRLQLHLSVNGIRNTTVESYAVSSVTGRANFFLPTSGVKTIAGLRASGLSSSSTRPIEVSTITLDEYCAKNAISAADVVKVDVEGAELDLLAGATHVIAALRPLWIIEVIDEVTQAWNYAAPEILRYLERHDYSCFSFADDGRVLPHAVGGRYPLQSNANYLAVPRERCEAFVAAHGCPSMSREPSYA